MSLSERVREFLSEPHPDKPGRSIVGGDESLVVAVSGGPDSLTLLHILAQGKVHPAEKLLVAHLDHGLRPGSAGEGEHVRETTRAFGIHCIVERRDVRALATAQGLTLEEAGRQARYEFLASVARTEGASTILTGHTADDQVETVLMNLLRGAGPRGLRGMLPLCPLPGNVDLTLARPLLTTTREEIEAYCRENQLDVIQDESNQDTAFFRNWVRLELLPSIDQRAPGVKRRLLNMSSIVAADYEALDDLTSKAWSSLLIESGTGWQKLDLRAWRALPLSMRRNTLRRALSLLRDDLRDVGFRTIELAREMAEDGQVGTEAILPGAVCLTVGYDDILLTGLNVIKPPLDLPQLPDAEPLPIQVPGRIQLEGGWAISAEISDEVDVDTVLDNQDPWQAFVALKEPIELWIRPVHPGESFQPLGLDGRSAEVREVMINRKIPSAARDRWPVVANDEHLIWLVGHHLDNRSRITGQTIRKIKLVASREE